MGVQEMFPLTVFLVGLPLQLLNLERETYVPRLTDTGYASLWGALLEYNLFI
jgi:hypothetical protein